MSNVMRIEAVEVTEDDRLTHDFYDALLEYLSGKEQAGMINDETRHALGATIRFTSKQIRKILVINDGDTVWSRLTQGFGDDGEQCPWMLIVVGNGSIEEFVNKCNDESEEHE